ncbi:hypothetical protein L1049_026497 [Liquidambar formosana]|uniref:Uncharacterized protein n=1 Tax=Liquidambar formosana TaxID=63359 RepID=A0AAP0NDF7_LIQFO
MVMVIVIALDRVESDAAAPTRLFRFGERPGAGKSVKKAEEWRFESKKSSHRVRIQAVPAMPFASPQSRFGSKQEKFYPRCTPRNSGPQSRDTPPKRDTGIANEKDWGINLLNENVNESGTNEDGSTWYRESGEDLGENGYRCRWERMGGQCHDGSSEWKEMWWEKSDWTGYKELGVEKSGRNAEGDSWWETWQEVLHQDEWSNLARIERSAQKQAKSGTENAGWFEKWWEKYDAKGWTEKGAHKYGRLNEQSWWEKWGEHYDGRGSVLKWTDKWAETELGTKWGDKWEERFFSGIGSRQGETWHVSPSSERMSNCWDLLMIILDSAHHICLWYIGFENVMSHSNFHLQHPISIFIFSFETLYKAALDFAGSIRRFYGYMPVFVSLVDLVTCISPFFYIFKLKRNPQQYLESFFMYSGVKSTIFFLPVVLKARQCHHRRGRLCKSYLYI